MKHILHIDLNNFYASVECLLNPEIANSPVAVCGDIDSRRGIVLAKNYIAKQAGVKTGMVIWEAKLLLPDIIIVNSRLDIYLKYSKRVKAIFAIYTDYIESFGVDESWLDVTHSTQIFGNSYDIAYKIKEQIKTDIGLTVSIGISDNKIYAKLASDIAGRDEIVVINRDNADRIIFDLPVESIIYVGRATVKKLNKLNIYTIKDLAQENASTLKKHLGKWGEYLHCFANGIDLSDVRHIDEAKQIKSIGNSMTNYRDVHLDDDIKALLCVLAESVSARCYDAGMNTAQRICISLKDSNLKRVHYCEDYIDGTIFAQNIINQAFNIYKKNYISEYKVRAIGVYLSGLSDGEIEQMTMIKDYEYIGKATKVETAVTKLRKKYGHKVIMRAVTHTDKKIKNTDIKTENTIHPENYFHR